MHIRGAAITTYDILGILIPGSLMLIGLYIFTVPYYGAISINISTANYSAWAAIAAGSYLLGVLAQLIGRLLNKFLDLFLGQKQGFSISINSKNVATTNEVLRRLRKQLHDRLELNTENVNANVLSNFTDEYVIQFGNPGKLEEYLSREMYYRGVMTSMLFIALACAFCALKDSPIVSVPVLTTEPIYIAGTLGILSIAVALSCYDAFRRLRRRRIRHSILSYLVLESADKISNLSIGTSPKNVEINL